MAGAPRTFRAVNEALTRDVVERIGRAGKHGAVIAEAPPGAGKSTLTASVADSLVRDDSQLRLAIVTQTNEQADDLVGSIARRYPGLSQARVVGSQGASPKIDALANSGSVLVSTSADDPQVRAARIVVSTARKWQYERARVQSGRALGSFPIALIDEAYQMRSDMLLGIADLYQTLFCVGDPGQLDPFSIVDDSLWKGLAYSPSRTALGTLRAFHPNLEPLRMSTSWRLPPSAASLVSSAFYPDGPFSAGNAPTDRALGLGKAGKGRLGAVDTDAALERAADTGWAYVELPEKFTSRTDVEIATVIAGLVVRLLQRGANVADELKRSGYKLSADRVAVVTAHNDQVHAVRHALHGLGQDPDQLVVSTANKIQGREYDVVIVWHPLAGRRDATAFHLDAGRMCVMLSRHRHACIVVNRAGSMRMLEEFPDSDPVFLDEPEKFPDGWEANHKVLQHLETHKT
jgi:hypothetical protein